MTSNKSRLEGIIQILIVSLYILQANGEGISCFRCYASATDYTDSNKLCSKFDGSAKFQVYCPTSTLCMKKTIYYKFKSNVTVAVQRYCAPQKRTEQTYDDIDNKWYNKEEIVTTAYEEGCFIGEDRGAPGGPPEYCLCGYNLCNSSESIKPINVHLTFLLIAALLLTVPL